MLGFTIMKNSTFEKLKDDYFQTKKREKINEVKANTMTAATAAVGGVAIISNLVWGLKFRKKNKEIKARLEALENASAEQTESVEKTDTLVADKIITDGEGGEN